MKSIVIIIPYFGRLPEQFRFWLNSAYNNPTIDFLLITDCEIDSNKNLKVLKMSFDDLVEHVQSKFEFKILLGNPYKLCDYKGAYGFIFEEYIKEYDFWGFGDVDLVYGNIRNFLTDLVLSKFKLILGWGHLTLYENTVSGRTFFKTNKEKFLNYKNAFTVEHYYHFDEFLHGGMSDLFKELYPDQLWDQTPFDDILVPRLCFNFKSVLNPSVSNHLIFEYINKGLFRVFINENGECVKEPTLYAHFQQRSFMSVNTSTFDKFLIVPNKFINHTEITVDNLKEWTKPRESEKIYWNLKNKVKRRLKMFNMLVGMRK